MHTMTGLLKPVNSVSTIYSKNSV